MQSFKAFTRIEKAAVVCDFKLVKRIQVKVEEVNLGEPKLA